MAQILYTKDHEYLRIEGGEGVVGISEHAQAQLGDVVFAETPPVGKALRQGDPAAVVESVKAASDVFAPAWLALPHQGRRCRGTRRAHGRNRLRQLRQDAGLTHALSPAR